MDGSREVHELLIKQNLSGYVISQKGLFRIFIEFPKGKP